jgi:hypothetical protein
MRGLVIREPWISKILAGSKTWEMRSTTTKIRGEIALIRQRSGLVVGIANLVESLPPLTRSNYTEFSGQHAIPPGMVDDVIRNRWVHPWVLADVRQLATPVPYKHKSGAVLFVTLDASVSDAIRRQTALPQTGVETESRAPSASMAATPAHPARVNMPDRAISPSKAVLGSDESTRHDDGAPVFVFRAGVAQAHGIPSPDGGFVVLKGSTAMREGSAKVKRERPLREELVRSGVLAPDIDGRLYRFSADHEFSSPSSAAGIVKDGNASGPSLWKDAKSGLSLKDFLDK